MITNFQKYQNTIKSLANKPRLLLHSCCAPCSSACLEEVTPYFQTDIYFYNPNITEKSEFDKRLNEQIRFVNEVYPNFVKVIGEEYNNSEFYDKIKGLEDLPEKSSRCYICYKLRLEKTAEYAKLNGYDYFATTLTLSPHKNADWLNQIGEELSLKYGVKFLNSDFKKKGGYLKSIELSKIYNLYRQDFCGCQYSKK